MKCDNCKVKCPQEELACEIAKGRRYAINEVIRLQKELDEIKQWKSDVVEGFCKYDASSLEELVGNVRNKAIDEFVEAINEHTTIVGTTYMCDIVLIAERLKGGA